MHNISCTTCLFGDTCQPTEMGCEDYYPTEDVVIDNIIDEMIEKHHQSFYQEWIEYINEFYN